MDQIPDVLNQSVDLCEQEMKAKLIPPVSPTDNYERTAKGVLSSKKTYVMVPEKDYEVLERRNGLSPWHYQRCLQPLRDAIMKSQVAQEIAREQRDKDDDVLGF